MARRLAGPRVSNMRTVMWICGFCRITNTGERCSKCSRDKNGNYTPEIELIPIMPPSDPDPWFTEWAWRMMRKP